MRILLEHYPYRFCESDKKDAGWIEKYNITTKRYFKMYECDSELQLATAMDDLNYCKWLDPDGIPCYNTSSRIRNPYAHGG